MKADTVQPFNEETQLAAMGRLTRALVLARRGGRHVPAAAVYDVDVGTVRLMARRAAGRRRMADWARAEADRLAVSDGRRASYEQIYESQTRGMERAEHNQRVLLDGLPEPWHSRACRALTADAQPVAKPKRPASRKPKATYAEQLARQLDAPVPAVEQLLERHGQHLTPARAAQLYRQTEETT